MRGGERKLEEMGEIGRERICDRLGTGRGLTHKK